LSLPEILFKTFGNLPGKKEIALIIRVYKVNIFVLQEDHEGLFKESPKTYSFFKLVRPENTSVGRSLILFESKNL